LLYSSLVGLAHKYLISHLYPLSPPANMIKLV